MDAEPIETRTAPLTGVRVLDLSRVLAGPFCTTLLADLGADVVKVEAPGRGDPTRQWGPPFVGDESTYFLSTNRGKRSLELDLTHPGARATLIALIARADVLVENFLPEAAARLDLDGAIGQAGNARLVRCTIAAYPDDVDDPNRPGFDASIQAEAALMSITGTPETGPLKVGVAVADLATGMLAGMAILAAVLDARRTGRGRRVEVSLFDATLALLANRASEVLVGGVETELLGNAHPSIVPYETFRAADGSIAIAAGTDRQFEQLCDVLEAGGLAADPRFRGNAGRVEHRRELIEAIAAIVRPQRRDELARRCARAGVPHGIVRTVAEVAAAFPSTVTTLRHSTLGPVAAFRGPFVIDGARCQTLLAPPVLGADSQTILEELDLARADGAG
jgi:crotonobetainyl-CoA:carnitine CoA-transferase CaiB-like acyl-CoA transferase